MITKEETVNLVNEAIIEKKRINHVVINASKVVNMMKDKELFNSVVSCDIINADGQSIVWASRFLGRPLPERVAGIDLMEDLVKLAHVNNYKCFFLVQRKRLLRKW